MCQQLTIEGTINGNVDVFAQMVEILETGVITGNFHAEGVQLLQNNGDIRGEITGEYQLVKNSQQTEPALKTEPATE